MVLKIKKVLYRVYFPMKNGDEVMWKILEGFFSEILSGRIKRRV